MFSNSSEEQRDLNLSAPMDLEETQGLQRPVSSKGNFLLAPATGQCTETVKASGRARFPPKFASPRKKEKLPFSQGSSEEKFLPSTACRSSYLLSLFRWTGKFCRRNTSVLMFEMPSFLLTTKIPRVASQTGEVKWSRFPAPTSLGGNSSGQEKRGTQDETILTPPSLCPRLLFFCTWNPFGSWELQGCRSFLSS